MIGQLSIQDFADLYSQTITYGLFAARTRAGKDFSRRTAFEHIPRTIGILRDVFQFVSLGDLPAQLEWIVDDVAEVLAVADAGEILDRFYREGKGSDPIVHFYETFLAVYDPAERERRGVYYTPEPVVGYIVRSLHKLLKTEFGRPDGLASKGVTLLDPAAGTMTFVARATEEAVREFEGKYGSGGRDEFIREHILKNFYAFELMMAPYAIGHLKMGFYLEELGHKLGPDERFQLYLTNTLEMEELEQTNFPGMESLARESHLAGEVKRQTPILVILGNPPYEMHSPNPNETLVEIGKGEQYVADWTLDQDDHAIPITQVATRKSKRKQPTGIGRLLREYYFADRKPIRSNPKVLGNDYVKFIRFAQWKIDQSDSGVIGMITANSYLASPTFRGMRQSLLRSFQELYILDLHGHAMIGEKTPEGNPDQNVFDISRGVAILFLIKRGVNDQSGARVFHADLYRASRERKYEWLDEHDIRNTEWTELTPRPGSYFFTPKRPTGGYQRFIPTPRIFREGLSGITTHRDEFVSAFSRDDLIRRLQHFLSPNLSDARAKDAYLVSRLKKGMA